MRLHAVRKKKGAAAQSSNTLLAAFEPYDVQSTNPNPIPFNAQDYLELVDWTGRHVVEGKRGFIPEEAPRLLTVLGICRDEWFPTVTELQSRFEQIIGSPEQISLMAKHQNKAWIRGIGPARRLYKRATAA